MCMEMTLRMRAAVCGTLVEAHGVRKRSVEEIVVTRGDTPQNVGEMIALEWPDIDFHRGYVTVTKSLAYDYSGKQVVKDVKTQRGRRQIRRGLRGEQEGHR